MQIISKRLLALTLLMTSAAYSQSEQKNRWGETIKLSSELVSLDAQVVNKKTGRVTSGLVKEDNRGRCLA